MLQIAGGILLAILALAVLLAMFRFVVLAFSAVFCLAVAGVFWLILASYVGEWWATATLVGAVGTCFVCVVIAESEKTAGELVKFTLTLPVNFLTLLLFVGAGFAAILFAAATAMAIIGLSMWVFAPIGIPAGIIAWLALCYGFQYRWQQRTNRRWSDSREPFGRF